MHNKPSEEDRAAILEAYDAYAGSLNSGNGEAWLSNWDEDGIQMPPGGPARGKDALRQMILAAVEEMTFNLSIDVEEVQAAGPWAYARGTYADARVPKAGGDTIHIDGKFLSILRRQPDGSWKIYRDCFSSNVPSP